MKDLIEFILAYALWVRIAVIALSVAIAVLLVFFHPPPSKDAEKKPLEQGGSTNPPTQITAGNPSGASTESPTATESVPHDNRAPLKLPSHEGANTAAESPGAGVHITQTAGHVLKGNSDADTYSESVEVQLRNLLDDEAEVTELRVSWRKLGNPTLATEAEGNPEGAMLIDRFVVRLTAEDHATCAWTYVNKDRQGHSTEDLILRLPDGNSILPQTRGFPLAKNEILHGEIVLKQHGLFEVILSGLLRQKATAYPFRALFNLYK